ncbi:hypothetical protein Q0N30_02060 [Priestia megaterium]
MDNVIVKLAKSYSNGLMEQIYFMELIKETEVIGNDLEVAELGGSHNE